MIEELWPWLYKMDNLRRKYASSFFFFFFSLSKLGKLQSHNLVMDYSDYYEWLKDQVLISLISTEKISCLKSWGTFRKQY